MCHRATIQETMAVHLLKGAPARPADARTPDVRAERAGDGARVLACATCGEAITTTADRIEVGGAHEHTFANPAGYAYRIGCFARAGGCRPEGIPTGEFTWFAGYEWQVERCGRCAEHLGWLFRATGHAFHGLVLDRLVERDEEGG